MNSSLILLKSVTETHKAKKQLSDYKIKCTIEKVSDGHSGGCRYGIRVHEEPRKVCRLLSIAGIYCDTDY